MENREVNPMNTNYSKDTETCIQYVMFASVLSLVSAAVATIGSIWYDHMSNNYQGKMSVEEMDLLAKYAEFSKYGTLCSIAAMVLLLVGLLQGGKDYRRYHRAFLLVCLSGACMIGYSLWIRNHLVDINEINYLVMYFVRSILSGGIAILYHTDIISATNESLRDNGAYDVVELGRKIYKVYFVVALIGIVIATINAFAGGLTIVYNFAATAVALLLVIFYFRAFKAYRPASM